MPVAKKDVSEEKDKPVFDEQTLAKLLEAAFVLQEHNREQQTPDLNLELQTEQLGERGQSSGLERHDLTAPSRTTESASHDDYTLTLAQIVEVQHEIQVRHLELEGALALVVERVTDIAKAGGAGIGILNGKKVHYQAVAGLMTLPADTEVSMENALCVACLRTGQVLRCADVNPEFLLDAGECHRRGIQSLIAVPVYHDGGIAGALELYYARTQAFAEQDVHTCQLMAGLITEALARDEELTRKKSPATERAAMLDALEKLKPSLAALLDAPAAKATATAPPGSIFICRKCGHQLLGQEQFCGKCGQPRSGEYEPPSMQSKVASLWHMQEAKKKSAAAPPVNDDLAHEDSVVIPGHAGPEKPLADSIEEEMPELFAAPDARIGNVTEPADLSQEAELTPDMISDAIGELGLPDLTIPLESSEGEEEATPPAQTALAVPPRVTAWSSAASARDFLEKLAPNRQGSLARLLQARRGDVYLTVAVILVVCVLGWGIWSNHSVGAARSSAATAGHHKPAPDSDLSWFDRMLVELGLAEVPEPPESKGNPDTQVWVDLQTALYYCPGADLYGKTPKGKFAAQRDAQLDQFQPASRKPCE
jgi:putative methionine-R-sulfoxide reductase with GAF domain